MKNKPTYECCEQVVEVLRHHVDGQSLQYSEICHDSTAFHFFDAAQGTLARMQMH